MLLITIDKFLQFSLCTLENKMIPCLYVLLKSYPRFVLHESRMIFGAFMRGRKPRLYRGEKEEQSDNKNGELKASRKIQTKKEPPITMKCGNALHEVIGDNIMNVNFNKSANNEIKSSAHSKYRCQYHIVFAPKYGKE